MEFYIKKIRLWFNKHPEPKDYEFKPNKVNVVTGDSFEWEELCNS